MKLSYSFNKVALAIYGSLELSLIKAGGLVLPFSPSPFRQQTIDADSPWGEANPGIGYSQIPEEELSYELFVVQPLSGVQLFATPWTAARQASLSFTISQALLKLMSIELVMPSNHLILCHHLLLLPQSFPALGSFPVSQLFTSGGKSIGASASASVPPMNFQG